MGGTNPLFLETPTSSNWILQLANCWFHEGGGGGEWSHFFCPSRDGSQETLCLLALQHRIKQSRCLSAVAMVESLSKKETVQPHLRDQDGRVNPCSCAFHRSPKLTHSTTFELLVPYRKSGWKVKHDQISCSDFGSEFVLGKKNMSKQKTSMKIYTAPPSCTSAKPFWPHISSPMDTGIQGCTGQYDGGDRRLRNLVVFPTHLKNIISSTWMKISPILGW